MPESNITKRALANSLKELMETKSFEKITVGEICQKCNMNRKSFYYHFKDKYDLVNWIFDIEFVPLILDAKGILPPEKKCLLLLPSMEYLYENRTFYRKILQIEGQNSFYSHMSELLIPNLKEIINTLTEDQPMDDFTLNFFTDAIFHTIQRWLSDENCMTADEFLTKIYKILYRSTDIFYEQFHEDKED